MGNESEIWRESPLDPELQRDVAFVQWGPRWGLRQKRLSTKMNYGIKIVQETASPSMLFPYSIFTAEKVKKTLLEVDLQTVPPPEGTARSLNLLYLQ